MNEKDWLMVAITALTSGGFGMLGVRIGLAVMEERVKNLKEQLETCMRDVRERVKEIWEEIRSLQELQRDMQTQVDKVYHKRGDNL